MTEHWLPAPDWERFYEVSDLGQARSLDRMVWSRTHGSQYLQRGRLLKPSGKRYLTVAFAANGVRRTVSLHQLVLLAFIGPCPEGLVACHGPGGRQDNRLSNLYYGTQARNMLDKYRDGTAQYGSRNALAKLDDDIVLECRARFAAGEDTAASLAREYGVDKSCMWLAITGRTWRHLDGQSA